MKTTEFIKAYKVFKQQNIRADEKDINDYIIKTLEVKTYIPFMTKRIIAETIVEGNTERINGIWKNDAINQYISFVIAMLQSHTNLEISEKPMEDYDMLAENDLLMPILVTFQTDYAECETVLKMALGMVLEENSVSALVGELVGNISNTLDNIAKKFEDLDTQKILGANFKEEDLAKLTSLLNKFVK